MQRVVRHHNGIAEVNLTVTIHVAILNSTLIGDFPDFLELVPVAGGLVSRLATGRDIERGIGSIGK